MTLSKMTVPKKIYLSFGAVLFLMLLIVIANYLGVGKIVGTADELIEGYRLDGLLAQREVDHLNWVARVNSLLTDEHVTQLDVELDDHKCGLGKWLYGDGRKQAEALVPGLAPLLQALEEPHRRLHESAVKIGNAYSTVDSGLVAQLAELENAHLAWSSRILEALISKSSALEKVQTDPTKCRLAIWMATPQAQWDYEHGSAEFRRLWDDIPASHTPMHASAAEIAQFLATGQHEAAVRQFREVTGPHLRQVNGMLRQMKEVAKGEEARQAEVYTLYAAETVPALRDVQNLLHQIRAEAHKRISNNEFQLASADATRGKVALLGLFAILAGMAAAFLITRAVIRPLRRISGQMEDGASQVAGAADQVSAASTSLAEGASEQAAALEESSSSLEEMSAMTRQNAENATQADDLMRAASETIIAADESMKKLTRSMEEISAASTDTQKIIKTIDEIAFQTNLLALNAAVEAARAGEAGAGFAVVAEEVRNLAMRTAESAKSTSGMIESILRKIGNGSALVSETSESFYIASQSTTRVGTLVSEIAAASREQAQGIEQVNRAISEVDAVTQRNAATAEESASASAQLTSQAALTKVIVGELLQMVGAKKEAGKPAPSAGKLSNRPAPEPAAKGKKPAQKALPPAADLKGKPAARKQACAEAGKGDMPAAGRSKTPAEVIPFDDDDFEDF